MIVNRQARVAGRAPGYRPSQAPAHRRAADTNIFERAVALGCFTLLLAFNVALPSLKVGTFPLRGLLAVGMLCFFAVLYTDAAASAVRRHLPIFGLAAGLAALGVFVSLIGGTPGDVIFEAVTEVHLQVAVTLLVAAILADICGARYCVLAIVAVIGASGLLAIFQMIGVDSAWEVQARLADVQRSALTDYGDLITRRPRGFSFSPIQLSTQACLALAAFMAIRDLARRQTVGAPTADPAVLMALIAFIVVCLATGTRSAILGSLVFFGFYAARRQGTWLPVVVSLAGILLYLAWPVIWAAVVGAQPRLGRIDGSAEGRGTLAYYGMRLFLDNPLGYGFDFKPFEYWTSYWQDLYTLPSPGAAQSKELHNYVLNMLNTYGVGLLLFVPVIVLLLKRGKASLIFFIPYILHIMFHNAGPFWNDTIVWFVVAALAAAAPEAEGQRVSRGGRRPFPRKKLVLAAEPGFPGGASHRRALPPNLRRKQPG